MSLPIFSPQGLLPDQGAVQQMWNCMAEGDAEHGVLCADHHLGYSMPIGGAIGYPDYVSPSGVGYDIGCGNKAVATSLFYQDIRTDLPRIMDEIVRRVSFGMGRVNDEPVEHPVFDRIAKDAPLPGIKGLLGLARKQLGTVGAGNHYVDLFREDGTDRVWIGVHFGSRGFGHKVASGFLSLAQGGAFDDRAPDGEMNAPPTLIHTGSPLGYCYIEAMTIAGEYAYAGRDVVVEKVLEILGSPAVFDEVHNHHNFAWLEEHFGQEMWVVRKGSTPLFPGQRGFVGSSMGEDSVIISGRVSYQDDLDAGPVAEQALHSAPHGAGRLMSRTEAKGKIHRKTGEVKKVGKIDWSDAQAKVASAGVILRGGAADEAPLAYKRLPAVLDAHSDYVDVDTVLHPIGVAMAGDKTFDPYKD